ncbi:hypothetical protein GH714_019056 [Hevea brasiliensis]|uniref:TVP38/TMEM64 family membrane protein n=1 Tax=Hevea brasiliensis TaxID=3981 RepID=A0A6A6MTX0_HEVBR|nr:hypothetical protein GH714_019056 [Hevea brasiliensis]
MPETSEESGKEAANSEHHRVNLRDSEYVRLVISNEPGVAEPEDTHLLQTEANARIKSLIWWIKALALCILLIILLLILLKWGVPFLFEKVLLPIMQWEATAFGRPVLALVLVASLALFPVFLIPSGPSMWLAGMIFGYGIGFVIIMVGTTIGMILPYLIGLLFRDRIHQWLKRWPQKAAMIRLAGEGIAFTVYAKRALQELERAETTEEVPAYNPGSYEMGKLPLERSNHGVISFNENLIKESVGIDEIPFQGEC